MAGSLQYDGNLSSFFKIQISNSYFQAEVLPQLTQKDLVVILEEGTKHTHTVATFHSLNLLLRL